MGQIKNLKLSRLISGGNLISGWAHSRDLSYVHNLMEHYNTPEKVLETLAAARRERRQRDHRRPPQEADGRLQGPLEAGRQDPVDRRGPPDPERPQDQHQGLDRLGRLGGLSPGRHRRPLAQGGPRRQARRVRRVHQVPGRPGRARGPHARRDRQLRGPRLRSPISTSRRCTTRTTGRPAGRTRGPTSSATTRTTSGSRRRRRPSSS